MASLKKKIIWVVVFILLTDVFIAVWVLVHDLKTRFPDPDLSRTRAGVASWYSKKDGGVKPETANGGKFDHKKMACASWDYPFGASLVVLNAMTGKWVVCRVNDRGPNQYLFRVMDLTRAAFGKIANPPMGLVYMTVFPTEK